MEQKSPFETFELHLSPTIHQYLKETANWSFFLSIIGFIGILMMVLAGIFLGVGLSEMAGTDLYGADMNLSYLGFVYVFVALIYLIPVIYLFNFSRKMKTALSSNRNEQLESAFQNLKSHYKFLGIFTIIIIILYMLLLILAVVGGTMF